LTANPLGEPLLGRIQLLSQRSQPIIQPGEFQFCPDNILLSGTPQRGGITGFGGKIPRTPPRNES
ncbi:hypothetical protein, partial [Oleiphilus sp. HI0128]|uniref:hypothetical protein n=1 Tax=Oleiphilus sp. HI0128 TaxID=1822267 RepID=UPI001E32B909